MVKGNRCTGKYSSSENNLRKKIFKVKAVSSEKPKRQSRIKEHIKKQRNKKHRERGKEHNTVEEFLSIIGI